jgi:hypothetical protein
MSDLERAIKDMEEARASHQAWLDHMRDGGDPVCTFKDTQGYERMWVRRYDRVLRLLRKQVA